MSHSDVDEDDDNAGGYTLEEYTIGPSHTEEVAADHSKLDFRMDAPPPSTSMESRLKEASEAAPEGMQLARPKCCNDPQTAQTGPKAVKADYEAAKVILRSQRMMAEIARERAIQPQKLVSLQDLSISPEEDAKLKRANKGVS
jgi:hypothetical protein